jgi:hypothetical protein
LAKVPEDRASESCTQVSDDYIGHTKAMLDVSDEFDYFFRCYFRNRSDFDPLGKFVDGHQYMFVATCGGMKRQMSMDLVRMSAVLSGKTTPLVEAIELHEEP